jgi:GcrA cell cycle regulator
MKDNMPWRIGGLTNVNKSSENSGPRDIVCSTIGDKMGNTRNAIIGKVHRLGLPLRAQAAQPVKRPKKLAFPKPPRVPKAAVASNVKSVGIPVEGTQLAVIKSDAFKPPVGTDRIMISDLTSSTCKWPLGDPGADDFTYCGSPTCSRRDVYCDDHRRIASQPGKHHRDKKLLRLSSILS